MTKTETETETETTEGFSRQSRKPLLLRHFPTAAAAAAVLSSPWARRRLRQRWGQRGGALLVFRGG
jgi:hypothetical protein